MAVTVRHYCKAISTLFFIHPLTGGRYIIHFVNSISLESVNLSATT
jgi:hypothetical protein